MNKLTIIALILGLLSGAEIATAQPLGKAEIAETRLTNTSIDTEVTTKEANTENSDVIGTQSKSFSFNFNNAFDYSSCMDVILLAYERRIGDLERAKQNKCADNFLDTFGTNISQELALQLVEAANIHATQKLQNALYPVLGIRRRVAINFGYVYEIDRNNRDILQLIDTLN